MAQSKKTNTNLFNSILYLVVGILFCVCNESILDIILLIAGVVFIVLGVLDLVKQQWASGAISLIIGLLILLGAKLFIDIVLLVFGILMAVKGGISLILAIKDKKLIDVIFAALTLVAGVLIALNRGGMIDWLFIVVGILLIVDGALGLIGVLTAKKK